MKRNLGMQISNPLSFAKNKLKDMENGSTLYYTAWNGQGLFIKENN